MASNTTGMEDALLYQAEKPTKAVKPKARKKAASKEGTVPEKEAQNHAAIEADIHMRYWAEKMLAGRTLTVEGSSIRISPPIDLQGPEAPPWANADVKYLEYVELLTNTGKMGAPSFALPVGAPSLGGSCPGSLAGMTTAPRAQYEQQKKRVLKVLREQNPKLATPVDYRPSDAVCSSCYVTGGMHSSFLPNNTRMVVRYAWTREAVAAGFFAQVMIDVIAHASYPAEPASLGLNQRYFRIHDAGDFYNPRYLQAWHDIAKAFTGQTGLPRTIFWAPTRIWATEWGDAAMKSINGGANFLDNFVVRPSAYVIDAAGPDYPIGPSTGYAANTVVARKQRILAVLTGRAPAIFDWSCPAQAYGGGACLTSPNPQGGTGCRVCWVAPAWRTAYGLH